LNRKPRRASRRELFPSDWPPTATISGIGSFSPRSAAAACSRLYASNRAFQFQSAADAACLVDEDGESNGFGVLPAGIARRLAAMRLLGLAVVNQ
jgi:hypothetical protein